MAGEILITETGDVGAQPVPIVVEFCEGIKFHRAGWFTSLGASVMLDGDLQYKVMVVIAEQFAVQMAAAAGIVLMPAVKQRQADCSLLVV
jgi:hypothetical protein